VQRSSHPPPLPIARYLSAWLVTAVTLGATALLLDLTAHPWLLASLGGSCVILFGMPGSEMAKPRSFIGGHIVATAIGLLFLKGFGQFGGSYTAWVTAAVATALIAMMLTRTIHSPAGGNAIIVFAEHADWNFLISPLLIGLSTLSIAAWASGWLYRRPHGPVVPASAMSPTGPGQS
jgi:CBS-domain-containing membrane protein